MKVSGENDIRRRLEQILMDSGHQDLIPLLDSANQYLAYETAKNMASKNFLIFELAALMYFTLSRVYRKESDEAAVNLKSCNFRMDMYWSQKGVPAPPLTRKVVVNGCFGGFGLSDKAISLLAIRGVDHDYSTRRDDPDLIAVIEELGSEANGRSAELRIVEIPLDIEWHIEEYDGREHVAETHRTWR